MKKRYAVGMFALLTIGLLGASFVSAFPTNFKGFRQELTEEEITEIRERKQEMMNAIDDKNFDTWKTLMEQRIEEMRSGLTKENFEKITEMNQQRMELREACKNGESDACGFRLHSRGKGFFGTNTLGD